MSNKNLTCDMCSGALHEISKDIYVCESCGKKYKQYITAEEETTFINDLSYFSEKDQQKLLEINESQKKHKIDEEKRAKRKKIQKKTTLIIALCALLIITCIAIIITPHLIKYKGFETKGNIITGYKGEGLEVVIPDGTIEIAEYAFRNQSQITSIVIPSSVTKIGYGAFYNCSSLTSIAIPNSVTSIGDSAFFGCSSLTSIIIPNSVTSIGSSTFTDCISLTSIGIPNSVTSIGDSAFGGCSSLASIEIPNSVTSIGPNAFYNCSSLTSITLPFIGNTLNETTNTHFGYIFGASSYSCNVDYIPSSLKEVIITGGTSIGNFAFIGCSSLTIYCEANSKPSGWNYEWNRNNCPVIWGYIIE